jgi:RNA-directed DNA polymerase
MTTAMIDRVNNWTTWKAIDWKTVEREVFRLQNRIYRASQNGNVVLVQSLQRLNYLQNLKPIQN